MTFCFRYIFISNKFPLWHLFLKLTSFSTCVVIRVYLEFDERFVKFSIITSNSVLLVTNFIIILYRGSYELKLK